MGGSKGGELALLLGATSPALKAVVAYVPSHVVWQGISEHPVNQSSWSYQGRALPFVPSRMTPAFAAQFGTQGPIKLLDLYLPSLATQEAVKRATIPVEKIRGAVLLISGKDDQMWPSSLMADRVIEQLIAHAHPYPFAHHAYESADHHIGYAYLPTAGSASGPMWVYGGTAAGNARAQADSWPKVLDFLRAHLAER
jgi:dienelactone hydrolase